jgi:cation transport regulator ChaC
VAVTRPELDGGSQLAVFAYGSLLFRPGFVYAERHPAKLAGYARRFSQASPDHRGTLERPGRVVTLVASAGALCHGALYLVHGPSESLLSELDYRERAGYERVTVEVQVGEQLLAAVTWIAPPGNPYDAGALEAAALAELVRAAHGPSGPNAEYVFLLEQALAELGVVDPHVSELSALLRG